MKLNQIFKKINFRHKKNPNRAFMRELAEIESLLWSCSTLKEYNSKNEELILDPLIDKLISKINSLMSKYC